MRLHPLRLLARLAARAAGVGLLLLVPGLAAAQVPTVLNYQGRLVDQGAPVTGTADVTFTLYAAATGGNALWTETQAVPVEGGVFSTLLGQSTPITADVLAGDAVYLGVSVAGGEEFAPRLRLASAPFALRAATVDNAVTSVNGRTGPLVFGSAFAVADQGGGAVVTLASDAFVTSLNGLSGGVTLEAGSNIAIEQQGARIIISAGTSPSSRTLKENVAPIADPLGLLQGVNGVTYEWRADGRADVGVLAEDVATVLPQIVHFVDGQPAGVRYDGLVPVLVEALKAQQQQIEAQQRALNDLRARLERLEAGQ